MNQTPVVVLRSGHHGGLGIVRSLGRMGVPVYCVDSDWWEPAFSSRYCRARFLLAGENRRAGEPLTKLLEIGERLDGRAILIATTDQGAIWVAEHSERLSATYRFPLQDATLVRTLCDKGRMQELAASNGVPTARSAVPQSMQDVEQYLDSVSFPIMVKATESERLRARAGGTKFVVRSHRELLDLLARAADPERPNLMLQELIPGEDWMFDGYFDGHSRCLFGVTGRKLRRFPVNTGVTSLGICQRNEIVEKMTVRFMRAIGYKGILDIGYRYDERDGQYKVLDVNPRIGCTFRLLTSSNGADAARALYLDLTGQQVVPSQAAEGRKWIVEDFDIVSALRLWRDHGLGLKDWVKSLSGVKETACFALDDPLPFFLLPLADVCEYLKWYRHRRGARLQPASKSSIATLLS